MFEIAEHVAVASSAQLLVFAPKLVMQTPQASWLVQGVSSYPPTQPSLFISSVVMFSRGGSPTEDMLNGERQVPISPAGVWTKPPMFPDAVGWKT
jgi:hypothetical protein